ncbi:MAG: 30S ribosomal protein S8 [Microgenomates group bacterium GW2011_GWF2_45_18]|nr:MAG: 30S ribosomal protein S8 [Microgenomates group bacterium GW2011_GWF1_44_10]KKU01980.1 MAG: 30S ribosomal protein S8 [Microgenomates group bacterium GW2011_GWF2_45_18]OGJ41005.1 MAG: 30S ribosomal protein S8 [Candidatus Pacebacteria bacterium RIFOXYB1_FULL_44_10]HAU99034.1 30S ribosomal protein S8 [Candidatus Paceibacterota bacterium]HAX01251.1 30S ribosomal protein S8 [Candidatus Paceibacterota bacterium]
MITDGIGDMIARIKNGYMARKDRVEIPFSKVKMRIAEVLIAEKYLSDLEVKEDGVKKTLVVTLSYIEGSPVVNEMKRVSKPGLRKYANSHHIPTTLNGYGLVIVTTSKGVMSGKEAKKLGVGGELLCSIW